MKKRDKTNEGLDFLAKQAQELDMGYGVLMEKIYKCPKCSETKNLHFNYDYSKQHRPIENVLCNECGEIFDGDMPVDELVTKPGFVERRMKQMKAINDKTWDGIYEEYSNEQYPPFGGPFTNALTFIEWLKQNYIAPERI